MRRGLMRKGSVEMMVGLLRSLLVPKKARPAEEACRPRAAKAPGGQLASRLVGGEPSALRSSRPPRWGRSARRPAPARAHKHSKTEARGICASCLFAARSIGPPGRKPHTTRIPTSPSHAQEHTLARLCPAQRPPQWPRETTLA